MADYINIVVGLVIVFAVIFVIAIFWCITQGDERQKKTVDRDDYNRIKARERRLRDQLERRDLDSDTDPGVLPPYPIPFRPPPWGV